MIYAACTQTVLNQMRYLLLEGASSETPLKINKMKNKNKKYCQNIFKI